MFQKAILHRPLRVHFRYTSPPPNWMHQHTPFFAQSNTGVSTPSNLWIFGDVVVYNICTFLSGKT